MGVGKPLKSILHMSADIPIYLGTGNESTVKLTAEIADGWVPMGFLPGSMPEYRPWLEEGFRRAGKGKSFGNLEIQASVHVEVNDDVKAALAKLKPEVALYVGGMGHRDKNFHKDIMVRYGFRRPRIASRNSIWRTARKRRPPPCRTNGLTISRWWARRPGSSSVTGLGSIGAHGSDGPIPTARGHRGDGGGGAAELRGGTTMRFKDKVALITAAANGIGRATCDIIAREGGHRRRRQPSGTAGRRSRRHEQSRRSSAWRLCDALDQRRSTRSWRAWQRVRPDRHPGERGRRQHDHRPARRQG